jgi:RNA polymerase sigma-70 factor, ECF subfamily
MQRTKSIRMNASTLEIETPDNDKTTHAPTPSDEELICAIQERDSRALETLLERYRGLLKSVILRIVSSHSCADDVLQECLVAIWNHAHGYSAAKGRPLGWLTTLAKRRAIDHLRREISYGRAMHRLETESRSFTFTQDWDCEDADMARVLGEHINLLPDKQQEVIRLGVLNGMSQREVARATNTPLGTVKTRMELALKKLRGALIRQGMTTL